jgi:hypothetical protein
LTTDFANPTDIANTTTTLTGDAMGVISITTYFRAETQACDSSSIYSATAAITIAAVTVWDGASWSNGLPSFSNSVIFAGNYTAIDNIESCSLTINSGVTVIVGSGVNMTLGGGLTINSLGSLTLNNNANLLQPEGAVNTGIITVKANSAPLYRLDYTLWSAPVTGQNLKGFSPATLTNRFYFYDSAASVNGAFAPVFNNSNYPLQTETSYNLEAAKGYLIRTPNSFAAYIPPVLPETTSAVPGVSFEGQFTGTPNNGTINTALSTALNGYNLVGNPFPSSVSLADFLTANSATIDGTIWLWRKIHDSGLGIGYATLTNAGLTSIQPEVTGMITPGTIAIGQGFFVKVKTGLSTASLLFDNSLRAAATTESFFRSQNATTAEKHRIWLNLSNATETISQNLIGYVTNATNEFDYGLDGKNFGNTTASLSSLIDSEEYNIQARSLPFDPTDVVHLMFKTNTTGTFTISINRVDGLFETNQEVILKDNLTGTSQNLKLGSYTFESQIGNFSSRFEIIYQNQLDISNPTMETNTVFVFKKNNAVHINSGNYIMDHIEIYDLSGRLLFSKANVNATRQTLPAIAIENQMLIIKIKTRENGVISKKIIY